MQLKALEFQDGCFYLEPAQTFVSVSYYLRTLFDRHFHSKNPIALSALSSLYLDLHELYEWQNPNHRCGHFQTGLSQGSRRGAERIPSPIAGCAGAVVPSPGLSPQALGEPAGHVLPPLDRCNYRCEERERFPGEISGRGGSGEGPPGRAPARAAGRCEPRAEERRWLPVAVPAVVAVPLPSPAARGDHWPREASLGRAGPGRAAAAGGGGGRKRRPRRAGRRERRWARPRPSIRATSPNGPSLPSPPPPLGRIVPRPLCMWETGPAPRTEPGAAAGGAEASGSASCPPPAPPGAAAPAWKPSPSTTSKPPRMTSWASNGGISSR